MSKKTRVIITGSSGMVGKNLTERLSLVSDVEVIAHSRSNADLMSFTETKRFFQDAQASMVVHCAGLVGGIQANISRPTDFLFNNLEIGKNVIMASKESKIFKLINLGSSCMYPKDLDHSLSEQDLLSGSLEPTNEGYALSKIITAKLCEFISKESRAYQYKTIIPCNLYGPYDKFDPSTSHMIPSIIMKIFDSKKNQSPVEIWGDGLARREFMHVFDLVDFLAFGMKNFDRLPAFLNVGLGHDYTVEEYYRIAARVIGEECKFVFNNSKPVGMKRKLLNVGLANALGWKYKMKLEDGIKNTCEYYQKVYK